MEFGRNMRRANLSCGDYSGPERRNDRRSAARWTGPERRLNRKPSLFQSLESRLLMHANPSSLVDWNDSVVTNADAVSLTLLANVQAASTNLPLSSLPLSPPIPGAPVTLYLDFVESAPAMTWLTYSVTATPAYDQDGDPTTFNSAELTSINEIWQGVSEEYSPFNINVTTVAPSSLIHSKNMEMVIGGSGAWLGAAAGGVSYIGAFTATYLPNISWIFPGELANGTPKYVIDATAHEAGHEFGLYHQATWSGTTLVADYSTGTAAVGPVMGDPYGDTRAIWYNGTNDISSTTMQDDMATITNATNGVAYRSDGISQLLASPTLLTGSSLSDSGIIATTTQVDYYEFTTGAGSISLSAKQFSISGVFNGMLSLKFSLYNSSDQLVTSSASGLTESINTTVAAGTYIVAISSDGSYGDVGQYTFSGTVVAPPPTTPTGLNATAASTSAINLSWTDTAGDETGFTVFRSTDDTNWTQIGTTTSTTYQDTGLGSATLYYYRICATNSSGSSGFTTPASATTQTAPPAAPTSLIATATSTTAISLNWTDNSNNETGFFVERSTDDSTWTQIASVNANVTTYSDSGLSSSTTYYYRVRANNAGGNSAYTNVSNATTQTPTPGTPATFTATAVSTTEIDLAWTDNSNQTGFFIERSTDNINFTQIASTTSTSYQNTGLSSSTTYYYRVRAFNGGGDSPYSSTASATTQTPLPTAPSLLQATAASTTSIALTWSDNSSNEAGFFIERSPDNSTWTQITSVAANTTTYTDSGLNSSTLYYYRVRAFNTGGDTAYTNVSSATTLTPVPATPSNLAANVVSTTEIDLSWTDNSNQTGFFIERSPDNSTWTQIATTSATTYQNTGLSSGTLYYYRVRANNSAGNSGYATTVSATTLMLTPSAPTSLVATANNTAEIDLSWTNTTTSGTGIHIERSPDNNTWTQITSVSPTTTSYIDTGLNIGATYFYRIRSYSTGGNSAYSNMSSAVAFPLIAPASPAQDVAAAPTSFSTVSIDWVAAPGDSGFYVQRSTDRTDWSTIAQLPLSATSYSDTTADSGTHYFYQVIAYNNAGNAPASNLATATTPNYSVILDDATPSDVSIAGTWSRSTTVAGYYGTDFLQDNNINKGGSSVTFAGLAGEWPLSGLDAVDECAQSRHQCSGDDYLWWQDGAIGHQRTPQRQPVGVVGTFNLQSGSGNSVTISNAGTNGVVVADAVQFVQVAGSQIAPYRLTNNVTVASLSITNGESDNGPLTLEPLINGLP